MKAVFAGSFDPVTMGHMDIIERSARLCETLYVLVAINREKHQMFDLQTRLDWLKRSCAHLPNVVVEATDGITANWAAGRDIPLLIRGIRGGTDAEYEANLAWANGQIQPDITSIAMFARPEYAYVSSSNVRELFRLGVNVQGLVPAAVLEDFQRMQKEGMNHENTH